LVVDVDGRIIRANDEATHLLMRPHCLAITGQTIRSFAGAASVELQAAIQNALHDSPLNVAVSESECCGSGIWIVQLRRLTGDDGAYVRGAVMMRLAPPPAGRRAVQFMGRLFGLARIEVEVLEDFVRCFDVDAIARRLSTTSSKVRAVADNLVAKTASRDLADVVAVTLCAASLASAETAEARARRPVDEDQMACL
jgi:hypothetical protein